MEKGSGFLVDTKGICLMCFRKKQAKIIRVNNNNNNPPNASTANANDASNKDKCEKNNNDLIELIVEDANGNLNPVKVKNESAPTKTKEEGDSTSAFSFRVLTRYLRVNLQKVFSLNVPFHSLHLLDKTELTVSLCPKCFVVADSFVKLCQELELIQMRIQGCLRKVHEVITLAENDKGLQDNYRKLMVTPNPLDLIQAGIVDNLRKEILEKCTRRMQKAFPRVRLEKVKVNPTEKASSLLPNIDIPALDLTAILTEETYLESIRRSASVIFTSSMKSSQGQDQGPINGNLQLETVIAPPSDPNSVENMDVFNEICDEIEIQSTSMTPPSSSSLQCENGVLDPMQCDNGMLLDPLSDPFPVEEEEASMLEEVSSPPTQHEQPEETDENDKDDYVKLCKRIIKGQPRFYCELCNQRVTSRQKHKRVVHREGLLKCAYCHRGFSEYRERKLHTTIQHHFEKYLIPIKPAQMTEEAYKEVTEACFGIITENRKDYSCPICNKSHRKTPNLRGHVVEHHFDLYKAKLDGLLNLNSTQSQQNIITYSIALPQNGNNNLLQFSSGDDDKLPDLEVIGDVEKIEALDQTFSQEDLNQSLLSDLDFTMSSSQLESSISEGSQSPALSQQQSQAEVEKDEDEEGSAKGGKSKYIVITGRKQDGRPLYFCNICKKSVTNTIMHKRIHHGEKLLHCEHCQKEVTTAYILREHTAQFHPTELFKSLKNEQCSDEQFAKFVDILIKDLIKKAIELKNPGEKQKCPLCMKECKQKGRWYLHLMDQHLQGLSEKLQEIQKKELKIDTPAPIKTEEKVQQVIVVQFQSPNASANTPKKVAAVKVSTSVPTSTPQPTSTTPTSQNKQAQGEKSKGASTPKANYSEKHRFTCDACGSRFTQSSSLKRHEKLYCKVNKPQETVVSSDLKKDVEYHPLLTPSIPSSQDSLASSSLSSSPKNEASCSKPITEPITTPSSSSIAEGLTTIDTSSLSWSIGSTAGGGNLGCSYCDKTFMFPYCQRTHVITAHRVETFSEHVPIGTSYEEVETVLSIILQDFLKTPNGMNSCNFCSKEYAQVSELESHVLISHFDEVVTKLKNLVQLREELILNPNFGASFDNFNLLNEDCVIEGNEELVGNGEGEPGDVADVQIFDLDQFPELREIYSSLSGGGSGGDAGDITGGGGDQDGIGMGIEQVMSAGNTNNDISMGDQLFF